MESKISLTDQTRASLYKHLLETFGLQLSGIQNLDFGDLIQTVITREELRLNKMQTQLSMIFEYDWHKKMMYFYCEHYLNAYLLSKKTVIPKHSPLAAFEAQCNLPIHRLDLAVSEILNSPKACAWQFQISDFKCQRRAFNDASSASLSADHIGDGINSIFEKYTTRFLAFELKNIAFEDFKSIFCSKRNDEWAKSQFQIFVDSKINKREAFLRQNDESTKFGLIEKFPSLLEKMENKINHAITAEAKWHKLESQKTQVLKPIEPLHLAESELAEPLFEDNFRHIILKNMDKVGFWANGSMDKELSKSILQMKHTGEKIKFSEIAQQKQISEAYAKQKYMHALQDLSQLLWYDPEFFELELNKGYFTKFECPFFVCRWRNIVFTAFGVKDLPTKTDEKQYILDWEIPTTTYQIGDEVFHKTPIQYLEKYKGRIQTAFKIPKSEDETLMGRDLTLLQVLNENPEKLTMTRQLKKHKTQLNRKEEWTFNEDYPIELPQESCPNDAQKSRVILFFRQDNEQKTTAVSFAHLFADNKELNGQFQFSRITK